MTNGTSEDNHPQWASTVRLAVYVTECIMIFTINAVTLFAFARNHRLRKRTTYLIINLTVADLLVGVVAEPIDLCYPQIDTSSILQRLVILILYNMFPVSSLINLSLIALERLHATLYPFRHCLIEKKFYFKTIFCSWLLTLLLSSVLSVSFLYESMAGTNRYIWISHIALTVLILITSYVIIIVNVKYNPPPLPFGTSSSDRKLSVTLSMVTVVSILTILPYAVYAVIPGGKRKQLSKTTQFHIRIALYVLYYANSLVNPLIYAIRMKEFRNALKDLICKRDPASSRVQQIELHAM